MTAVCVYVMGGSRPIYRVTLLPYSHHRVIKAQGIK